MDKSLILTLNGNRIGVLGGGSWGTAIVKMLLNNNDKVHWWVRDQDAIDHINEFHHNPKYLRSVELNPEKLELSASISKVVAECDLIVVAVPAAFLHDSLVEAEGLSFEGKNVVSAIKGIIPQFNLIPAEYFNQHWNVDLDDMGIIAGPCHAEEVALEKLSYLTVAFQKVSKAEEFAENLKCRYINVLANEDLLGTEYCAVLKNIYAIASGICHGIGYGDNFQAVLISNAIREAEMFVDCISPVHRDVKSSAYLGDLLVTAYSQFSRNRTFGNMIGKGYSVKYAKLEMQMVAEGYYAANCIHKLLENIDIEMPIAEATYEILYNGGSPRQVMKQLQDKLI